jgi:hypothetical protein
MQGISLCSLRPGWLSLWPSTQGSFEATPPFAIALAFSMFVDLCRNKKELRSAAGTAPRLSFRGVQNYVRARLFLSDEIMGIIEGFAYVPGWCLLLKART